MVSPGEWRASGSSNQFMLRPSGKVGLALLLAVGFAVSAATSLAQVQFLGSPSFQPPKTSSQSSTASAVTTPASKSKALTKKTAQVAEAPQTPPPAPTLEQQPPTPPQVSYQNGQLTIDSQNATLSQVLHSVQTQTGASVDMPPGAGSERVVAKLGPGQPKDVLASLLNGSKFNYVILGEANNSGAVQKVILMAKSASTGGATPGTTPPNNIQPPTPSQALEPPDEEIPQNDPEPEVQQMPGQPGMPGSEGLTPDVPNPGLNQVQPGGRTPDQMLQELQRMQQQQQQYQQQLNPSNQQQGPFPIQPQAAPQ
jgi:hypothetical protein